MKKIAAIYARCSTGNQGLLEDQLRKCNELASREGYEVPDHLIFIDEAVSGTVGERDGITRLLEAASQGLFTILLIYDVSRLARGLKDALHFNEILSLNGIEVLSVTEGFWSADKMAKITLPILLLGSQLYVDRIRELTIKAHERKLASGFVIGTLPYGFIHEKVGSKGAKGVKPKQVTEEVEVVRRIFREFLSGSAISTIVSNLNLDGIHSRKGTGWNASEVSRILRNEIYTGVYVYGRTTTVRNPVTRRKMKRSKPPETWQRIQMPELAIISREEWNAAAKRLSEVTRTHPERKEGRREYTRKAA